MRAGTPRATFVGPMGEDEKSKRARLGKDDAAEARAGDHKPAHDRVRQPSDVHGRVNLSQSLRLEAPV